MDSFFPSLLELVWTWCVVHQSIAVLTIFGMGIIGTDAILILIVAKGKFCRWNRITITILRYNVVGIPMHE